MQESTQPAEDERRSHPWRIRILIILLLASLLPGWMLYRYYSGVLRLERAFAEADRSDPHWRWEDLEARRAVVPNEENSARVIKRLARDPLLYSVNKSDVSSLTFGRPANAPLDPSLAKHLREALAKAEPVLVEARKLADMPRGRHREPGMGPFEDVREVCWILRCDVLLRSEDGDGDGALRSCLALLNAARSFGDEPSHFSMRWRSERAAEAVENTQRVLAQGSAAPESLLMLQASFEREAAEPLLIIGTQGYRAGMALMIGRGEPTAEHVARTEKLVSGDSVLDRLKLQLRGLTLPDLYAAIMEHANQVVRIAHHQPMREQRQLLHELHTSLISSSPFIFMVGWNEVFARCHRGWAMLQCATIALAAERYRLAHGRWPATINDLVPDFLVQVAADPFGDGPLKLAHVKDGLIIYSVSMDGQDNGGKLSDGLVPLGTDLGFRLWHPEHRRALVQESK